MGAIAQATDLITTHLLNLTVQCPVCNCMALRPGRSGMGQDPLRVVRCAWTSRELAAALSAPGHILLDAQQVISASAGAEWQRSTFPGRAQNEVRLEQRQLDTQCIAQLRRRHAWQLVAPQLPPARCAHCARVAGLSTDAVLRFRTLDSIEAAKIAKGKCSAPPWVTAAYLKAAQAACFEVSCLMFMQLPRTQPKSGWRARAIVCWLVDMQDLEVRLPRDDHGKQVADGTFGAESNTVNVFTTMATNARVVQWERCLKKRVEPATKPASTEYEPPWGEVSNRTLERFRIHDLTRFENPNPGNSEFPFNPLYKHTTQAMCDSATA